MERRDDQSLLAGFSYGMPSRKLQRTIVELRSVADRRENCRPAAHPESHYFLVGQIARDQVEDYARRKQMRVADVERWLAPNLGYEPEASAA